MADRKRTDVDWQDLRVFLALGRHGSLSAAARALGVNHATIARRIRSLEQSAGAKLVERRPEGYALTSAGNQALAAAGDMEAAARAIGRSGTDDAPKGLVRVNASPALAHGFLARRLAGLTVRHAALDIDLASDIRSISLERHEADIAIRLSRPEDGDVIARPLVTLGYGFYGTPAACLAVEHGAEPVFIGFDEADGHVPEAGWLARHYPRRRVAFRASNQFAQAMAALSGAGLALLPHYIGRSEPGLRGCALDVAPPPRDAWMLIRRRDRGDLAIRTVAEGLAALFDAERALFAA
ncbi:LysR family transcriptional regulator [Novosphingobium sp. PS1R-30]|uniref:LysR family transcriptional regulator n=1 Tax=Novosphingobium anseongense TaxID=3133436 RepID=A0ABU8RTH7_9SPHN